jgi:hypothetical protein
MLAASRSLWRSKTNVGAKFKRLRVHLGAAKAITAMAHDLARLVYRMLKYGQQYVDEGMEFYQQRYQQQQINWMQKKAKDFGPIEWLRPSVSNGARFDFPLRVRADRLRCLFVQTLRLYNLISESMVPFSARILSHLSELRMLGSHRFCCLTRRSRSGDFIR